jgi:outer membrane protein TolC
MSRRLRTVSLLAMTLALGGCMGEKGFGSVSAIALNETGQQPQLIASEGDLQKAAVRSAQLMKKPLDAQSAVELSFLNNRALQASFNELGLAQAALIRGSLPANPRFGVARLSGGGELEIEREVLVGLFSVLTTPLRAAKAQEEFAAAQMRAAESTLRLAIDVRRQFYRAVAANEQVVVLSEAKALTDTQADIAKKLGETGGLNKLDQAREYALAAELDNQLARARLNQKLERERLTRLLGLWGKDTEFKLPARLPILPGSLRAAQAVEAQALTRRVDLAAQKYELEALAISLGLTQATRFVTDIELIGRSKEVKDRATNVTTRQSGGGLEFEIPLFDFGAARSLEAEQRYMRAANLLADKAVRIRSEAREAYAAYRGSWEIARHYDKSVLPLRQEIQNEMLLHYNGMLKDLSSLITDTRATILARMQAIDAKRDFWIAENEMRAALAGGGTGTSNASARVPMASAAPDAH